MRGKEPAQPGTSPNPNACLSLGTSELGKPLRGRAGIQTRVSQLESRPRAPGTALTTLGCIPAWSIAPPTAPWNGRTPLGRECGEHPYYRVSWDTSAQGGGCECRVYRAHGGCWWELPPGAERTRWWQGQGQAMEGFRRERQHLSTTTGEELTQETEEAGKRPVGTRVGTSSHLVTPVPSWLQLSSSHDPDVSFQVTHRHSQSPHLSKSREAPWTPTARKGG